MRKEDKRWLPDLEVWGPAVIALVRTNILPVLFFYRMTFQRRIT